MFKSSISILNEFCQNNKLTKPTYEWTQSSDGQFECTVKLYDDVAKGVGQNKSLAKHNAANNMITCKSLDKYIIPVTENGKEEGAVMLKSSISLLSEYCQKNKLLLPIYSWNQGMDGKFVCTVMVYTCENSNFIKDTGTGISKSEAKNNAATNIFKQIIQNKTSNRLTHIMPSTSLPMSEPIQFTKPFNITIIEKIERPLIDMEGTDPNASLPKKAINYNSLDEELSEKLTISMPKILPKDRTMHMSNKMKQSAKSEDQIQMENNIIDKKILFMYQKLNIIKSYKFSNVRLCDRHNYFLQYSTNLKKAAIDVINSKQYSSIKDQALDVLKTLQIKFKIFNIFDQNLKPLIVIELECEYDVIFAQPENRIYTDILYYFKEMLQ